MANAYATLASGGIRNEAKGIRKVVFPNGKSDDLGNPERKRVLSDGVAYEVTKILKQNVQSGTGTRANIGCPAAGKTGTTDKFNDAWFVGYTPKLATATWVGFPNALQSMPGVAGGTIPASIWHDYMMVAKGHDCEDFPQPKEGARFKSFVGKYSQRGGYGSAPNPYAPPAGTGGYGTAPQNPQGNTGGNGTYYAPPVNRTPDVAPQTYNRGYDPRLYAEPPQGAPDVAPPSPPVRVPRPSDPDQDASDPQP
jgi:penicillin-binding protein 1A